MPISNTTVFAYSEASVPSYWDGTLRSKNGGRILKPGEREEFVICYETLVSKTRFGGSPADRSMSDWLLGEAHRSPLYRPLYRIRIIHHAAPVKPKCDFWVRWRQVGVNTGYDVMDGSDVLEGDFEYRSSAEDRIAELLAEDA